MNDEEIIVVLCENNKLSITIYRIKYSRVCNFRTVQRKRVRNEKKKKVSFTNSFTTINKFLIFATIILRVRLYLVDGHFYMNSQLFFFTNHSQS